MSGPCEVEPRAIGYVTAMVRCRTMPLVTEAILASLIVLAAAVGVALLAAFGVGRFVPGVVVGVMLLAVALQETVRARHTATRLSIDPATGMVTWQSLISGGELPATSIRKIVRARSRPGVYIMQSDRGKSVSFWLMAGNTENVRAFFDALRAANPAISFVSTSRDGLWWRAIP